MNTVSERLKFALKARNMKQIDLVTKTGIGKSSISTYLSGEYEPKQKNISRMAKALGVNEGWLMGADLPMEDDISEPMTPVPLVGEAAAGEGVYADNNIIDYIKTPDSWLKGDGEFVYLKVKGDSMEPEMHSGDLALIRVQSTLPDGEYGVVIIDGENGVIKRVIYDKNWVELQSVNTMYSPRRFENEELERVRVFGIVRKIIRNYDGTIPMSDKKFSGAHEDIAMKLYRLLDSEDQFKIKAQMEELLSSDKYKS